jgi:type 1 glutamine amidotransferase
VAEIDATCEDERSLACGVDPMRMGNQGVAVIAFDESIRLKVAVFGKVLTTVIKRSVFLGRNYYCSLGHSVEAVHESRR